MDGRTDAGTKIRQQQQGQRQRRRGQYSLATLSFDSLGTALAQS